MRRPFLPDANVFLHALNAGSAHHAPCRRWLEKAHADGRTILVNDLTECALLRVSTLPRVAFAPMEFALKFWQALLDSPFVRRAVPGESHRAHLLRFIEDLNLTGNDINDGWLAALALDHRAILVSTDRGFARFPGLDWIEPAE